MVLKSSNVSPVRETRIGLLYQPEITQPTHLPKATETTISRNLVSRIRAFSVSADRTLVAPVRNQKPVPENPLAGLIVPMRSSSKTFP